VPLPLLALAGIGTAGLGTVGGIWQSTANDAVQRENRQRLEQLRKLQAGGKLGLNPLEERQLQDTLVSPVQKAAAEGRLRAEQIAASTGSATAGDMSRLRTEQTRANGEAGQQAAIAVRAADQGKRKEQLAEIEQREQARATMKADDLQTVLSSLSQSAAAGGAIAGSPPGTLPNTLLGIGGLPFGGAPAAPAQVAPAQAALAGLTPAQQQQLAAWAQSNPDAYRQALLQALALQGGAAPLPALPPGPRVPLNATTVR
jgi:hypothetical protein